MSRPPPGASVFFKCENLQLMGAFKFRGAFNALSRLDQPARALAPDCKVYGVEPEAGNDGQLPLRRGSIVRIEVPKTIADGAQTQSLGRYTFEIIRRDVADILTVSDAELIDAMREFAATLKIVVEPTGCLGLAGARARSAQIAGRRVGVIVSGGNVEPAYYGELLARGRSN
jgi:threo-3-hydroxy-L-aspartate ammonia-lyase